MCSDGFTGGPLVDVEGRLSVTVPMATIYRVFEAQHGDGHVKRGFICVSSQPVKFPDGSEFGLLVLLVLRVAPDGPANAAGVHFGDSTDAVDGSELGDHEQLLRQLGGEQIGYGLQLTVLRTGERITVEITVSGRSRRCG